MTRPTPAEPAPAAPPSAVFRLHRLTYRYPVRNRGEVRAAPGGPPAPGTDGRPALDALTVDFPPGVTGILGLSGSGKTTLLNVLGLLDETPVRPGEVTYHPDGRSPVDYATLTARERVGLRQAEFGFVLQSSLLLPHLSCLENVAVPLALAGYGRAERRARAERLFDQADPTGELSKLRRAHPRHVSGGERQRVAILRAVAHDPRVVFADEPFSSLDPRNTEQILALLRRWLAGTLHPGRPRRDRTLLLVSHTVRTTIRFAAGRCLVVDQGRAQHTPADPPLYPSDDVLGPPAPGLTDGAGI